MEPLLFFIHCRGRLNLPDNILKGVCIRADSIRPYSKWGTINMENIPSEWKLRPACASVISYNSVIRFAGSLHTYQYPHHKNMTCSMAFLHYLSIHRTAVHWHRI